MAMWTCATSPVSNECLEHPDVGVDGKGGLMRTRLMAMRMVILALAVVVCSCEKKFDDRSSEVPKVKMTLELTGTGLCKPTTFTYEQLADMPMKRLDNVLMRKTHYDNETTSWEGPALEPLLAAAEIKPGPMKVTLVAEDGYEIEATLDDMKDAVVAMKNGQGRWIVRTDEDCEWKLVPPHKPGNFWIMNLSRIKVEPAAETPNRRND